jgi:hypothetical protein
MESHKSHVPNHQPEIHPQPLLESVELLTSLAFLGDQPRSCSRVRERVRSCDIALVMAARNATGFVMVIYAYPPNSSEFSI